LADRFGLYRNLGRIVFLSVDPDDLRGEVVEEGGGGRLILSK
jgi:hypothetical protein